MTSIKQSKRIQNSVLGDWEKKTLTRLAKGMPAWMTSDMLTFIGVLGAVISAVGYILSNHHPAWLWLASFGFVVNWFGDSLDGTLARVRNTQRPVYGYYLDHTVDVINEGFIFLGAGSSPYLDMRVAVISLVVYFALTINVSINAHLRSEFKLSYAGFGPTEFRILMILINTLLFFFSDKVLDNPVVTGLTCLIPVILSVIYVVTIFGDAKYYAKVDPPKKYDPEKPE